MWTSVVVTLLLLVDTAQSDCGQELLDLVAVITDQYRNVDEGVHKNFPKWGESRSPSFKSIVSQDLRTDICYLTKYSSEVFSNCETCPGCGSDDLRCAFRKLDLAILFDESASLNDTEYNQAKQFVADLVGLLMGVDDDTVRISLTSFARNANVRFNFADYIGDFQGAKDAVMDMTRTGNFGTTNTDLGFSKVRTDVFNSPGDRLDVPNVLLHITDGQSKAPGYTLSEFEKFDPATMFLTIAVGDKLNVTELELITSKPLSEYLFYVDDFNTLGSVLTKVAEVACQDCSPPCENGGECVKMSNTCHCPEEYVGSRCQTMSLCSGDDWK